MFFKSVVYFREWALRNEIEVVDLRWFSIVFLAYLGIYLSKRVIYLWCWDFVEENLNRRYAGRERELRCIKIMKWIYDTGFYSGATVSE